MKKKAKQTHKNTLSPKHQETLRKQVIDEHQPGTILRDFEVLLHFVRDEGSLKATKNKSLLPMACLAPINNLLSHPIRLDDFSLKISAAIQLL